MVNKCLNCEKLTKNQKYCCCNCHNEHQIKNKKQIKCLNCEKLTKNKKYCCYKCFLEQINTNKLYNKCLNCGKNFYVKLSKIKNDCGKYCSRDCHMRYNRNIKYPNLKFEESDFSQRNKEMVAGSMLGDNCSSKLYNKNSNLSECHGIQQKDYLLWKQNELPIPCNYKESWVKGRKNKRRLQCQLTTISHPFITEVEKDWYLRDENNEYIYKILENGKKQRIKCLPSAGIELTDFVLAIWFFDDGHNNQKKKECIFCTDCFTYDEVLYLSMKINETFGIKSWLRKKKNKDQFRIIIGSESYLKFLEIIRNAIPDIPKCMHYKFDTSNYKEVYWNTPDYHPCSKLNDEKVKLIFIDAGNGMSQTAIGKKYDINRKTIGNLLNGKLSYESEFANKNIRYNNKTGVVGVFFSEKYKKWCARIKIKGKTIHLGEFKIKEDAIWIRKQAEELVKQNLSVEDFKSKIKDLKKEFLTT